jgi:Pyruvate/2-oxoacid:ferredoxin oxidoreductase delta subunit
VKRQIIKIDESKCNGCGLCVPSCAEGAIQVIDGKARLISETYCDGLGACLGDCPQGALTIEEREAAGFDEAAVAGHLHGHSAAPVSLSHTVHDHGHPHGEEPCGCPGSRTVAFSRPAGRPEASAAEDSSVPASDVTVRSELTHWPVQLRLVSPSAPYFHGADLVVAADCAPFAYADFHRKFLRGKAVVIGCPKLDDADYYVDKLASIIRDNDLAGVTTVHMEVPCCFGLNKIVSEAVAKSGQHVPVREVTIGIQGDVVGDRQSGE